MRLPHDVEAAVQDVSRWLRRPEWQPLLARVLQEHLALPLGAFGVAPDGLERILFADDFESAVATAVEDALTRPRADGVTPLDDFLRRRGRNESSRGRAYLETYRSTAVGLYQVEAIDEESGAATLRDGVREGETIVVAEGVSRDFVAPGDWVALRPDRVQADGPITAPLVFWFGDPDLGPLAARIRARAAALGGGTATPETRLAALREAGPLITNLWLADAVSAAFADGEAPDDGRITEWRLPLVGDAEVVARHLDATPDLERLAPGVPVWFWMAEIPVDLFDETDEDDEVFDETDESDDGDEPGEERDAAGPDAATDDAEPDEEVETRPVLLGFVMLTDACCAISVLMPDDTMAEIADLAAAMAGHLGWGPLLRRAPEELMEELLDNAGAGAERLPELFARLAAPDGLAEDGAGEPSADAAR